MPHISVVIPTYNRAHLISQTIDSVLSQTFSDIELIVVDDGSADNTQEVVHSFTDPRLRYVKQSNQGAPVARNTGIKAARGEFVAFLDSDDLFLPEKLALQIAEANSDPTIDFVYGRYYATTPSGRKILAGGYYSSLSLRNLLLDIKVHLSTVLVKRSWLEKVGGFDEQCLVSEEWDLYLRLALAGCHMVGGARPVALIKQEPASLGKQLHNYEEIYISVLDRAFADPRMAAEVQSLRNRAYGMRFVLLAASAYLDSQPEVGKSFLEQAITTDPTLAGKNVDLLTNKIVNHILGLSLDDPQKVFQQINTHLPGNKKTAKKLARHLWARYYLQQAFVAHRTGQPAKCRNYALKAIAHRPSHLQEQGLLSIFLRSLVGNKLVNRYRRSRNLFLGT